MDCEDCKNHVEYAGFQKLTPICKECVDEGYESNWKNIKSKFESKHKPTNADKIRAMTDEELADFILHKIDFCLHRRCNGKCLSCFIEWLKKEVEDG